MNPLPESRILESWARNASGGQQPSTYAVVREWHNATHPGMFDYCDRQPCHAVVLANRPGAST
jgi:hypothetical protein